MKAISLWQPWASLIAIGAKEYETRSWKVPYRGQIAIHAAKRWTAEERTIAKSPYFREALEAAQIDIINMPIGCIVAIGELTAIYKAGDLFPKISRQEQAFGNFEVGRYAWRIQHVKAIAPIPMVGQQGLFEIELDL